jgi:hypothetical protein
MRLACASLVSATGGVPLILDDVLGWSDPGRVRRLGQVLASAGNGAQVIILTCTPERFGSVIPGTVISLPSGRTRTITAEGAAPGEVPPQQPTPQSRRHSIPAPSAAPLQAGFDLFDPEPASRN